MAEETRERILDAAEREFADKGYAGASLRDITAAAGVNVAAVNYHFGSKDELVREVLGRIIRPANEKRLAMLDEAERRAGTRAPSVRAILTAFLKPDLEVISELGERGRVLTRFIGRSYTEPQDLVRDLVAEHFGELGRRFHRALCRALPAVPEEEVWWRLMAVVGLVSSTLAASPGVDLLDPEDLDGTLSRMLRFIEPGMKAPPPPQ